MTSPKAEDIGRATSAASDQIKTSLFAVLGAGDVAGQVITDFIDKVRNRANGDEATSQGETDSPSVTTERSGERVDPAEVRALLDDYTDTALKFYRRLAESGNRTWQRLAVRSQVEHGATQLDERLQAAQQRVDDVTSDVRGRIDDVVNLVTGKSSQSRE